MSGAPGPPFPDEDATLGTGLGVTSIGDALAHVTRARGLRAAAVLSRVLSAWEEAVGPDVARHVQPVALQHRELVCEVDEAAWATQISLLSSTVLSRLDEILGERVADQVSARVRPRRTRR